MIEFDFHPQKRGGRAACGASFCLAGAPSAVGVPIGVDDLLPFREISRRLFDRFQTGDGDPNLFEGFDVVVEIADRAVDHGIVGDLQLGDCHQADGGCVNVGFASGRLRKPAGLGIEAFFDECNRAGDVGNRTADVVKNPNRRRG